MPAYQVRDFLSALRRYESSNHYDYTSEEDDRRGAYGITPENWRRWTVEMGLIGAPWQSKEAQDMVAREKASELYDRYRDWQLVALAWWGGTEFADDAAARGADPTIPMMDEAAKLTAELGPPLGTAPIPSGPLGASQPNGTSEGPLPQTETHLTKAIKASGHMRAPSDVKAKEMHHLIVPILQGLSNVIKAEGARGEGIPEPAVATEGNPDAGSEGRPAPAEESE
jgi:hypothetical protein